MATCTPGQLSPPGDSSPHPRTAPHTPEQLPAPRDSSPHARTAPRTPTQLSIPRDSSPQLGTALRCLQSHCVPRTSLTFAVGVGDFLGVPWEEGRGWEASPLPSVTWCLQGVPEHQG